MVASFMDPVDMQQVAIENKETTVIADELLTSQFLTTTQKPSPERKTTKNPLKIGLNILTQKERPKRLAEASVFRGICKLN